MEVVARRCEQTGLRWERRQIVATPLRGRTSRHTAQLFTASPGTCTQGAEQKAYGECDGEGDARGPPST